MSQIQIPGLESAVSALQQGKSARAFGALGKFLGRTIGEAAAFSTGVAIGPVLGPITQALRNTVNSGHAYVYPDAGVLADGVAQGQVNEKDARLWASFHGIGDDAFTALVSIANVGPGMAQAFNLWRRKKIDEPGFRRALKRLGLEKEWIDALWEVREEVLDPADLARGIHRGLIPDPGLLQGTLPSGEGHVSAYPVYNVDALAEALAAGLDKDHLGVLVGLQGNPMGAHEAAQAYFRAILTNDDYLRAIAEGNTRNEWADAIREQSRQIPTSHTYVEGRLRGWLTDAAMNAGTARHGMTPEDTNLEFLVAGRPMTWHQVFIGLRRGGSYDGPTTHIPAPILKAMQESNLRPEWYNLAYAAIETLPSVFVLRTLTQAGDFTADEAYNILLDEGWNEPRARKVANRWGLTKAAAQKEASAADLLALYDGEKATLAETLAALEALGYPADEAQAKVDVLAARRVTAARNAAISDLHGSFKKGELLAPAVTEALGKLVLDPEAAPHIVAAWQAYRDAFPPPAPTPPPPVA